MDSSNDKKKEIASEISNFQPSVYNKIGNVPLPGFIPKFADSFGLEWGLDIGPVSQSSPEDDSGQLRVRVMGPYEEA